MRWSRPVFILVAASLVCLAAVRALPGGRPGEARPAGAPVPFETDVQSIRLLLGVNDREARAWDGEVSVSGGSLARLEGWGLGEGETVSGTRWALRSRPEPMVLTGGETAGGEGSRGQAGRRRGQGRAARLAAASTSGIVAEIRGTAATRVRVVTRQGEFSFTLGEAVRPLSFLGGAATAERVPVHRRLTATATDDDFPAVAAAPGGAVWCAYVAHERGTPLVQEEIEAGRFESLVPRGNGDQVRLVRFEGGAWSGALDVTAPGLDVWRPAVGVDGTGQVWVVWSQGVRGNWDLYARSYDPRAARFGPVRRLTSDAGPDIHPALCTIPDPAARTPSLYLAWQAWRDGQFDVRLAGLSGDGELRGAQTVSTSRANDWSPVIGATPAGDVWVAWDTYDRGNYDVMARRLAGGKLDPPVAVAASPRFEARASLAVDRGGRVWIAFEDAEPNWGKDHGTRWEGKSGTPFYITRQIRVRCVSEGAVQETAAVVQSEAINTTYPPGRRQRLSIPRLGVDGRGRLWLLFRRHPLPSGAGERWVSFATTYEGGAWTEQIPVPRSENLLDKRAALVAAADGLLAVYPTDSRAGGTQSARDNDLIAAHLRRDQEPASPALVAARTSGDGAAVEPVHPDEAGDIARIRAYRVAAGGKRYRLLRGEFHRHTEISSHRDQDGPFEEIWRYGLDVARMDWIGPGDHDAGFHNEYLWWLTEKQVEIYHQPPVFTPMFTHERSVVYPSGHRNVVFALRGTRPLPRLRGDRRLFGTPEAGAPDIKNLYAYLRRFDGICSSHTSATNMGTDWRDNDPKVEPVVEIYQGHRQNYEEPKAPKAAKSPEDSIGGYQPAGFVWNAFAKGYRLGFQTSSDHVSTHISYAIVLAERPTREAILDAFKRRHSYGAHDNIILDVRCGEHVMGDEFTVRTPPRLSIRVVGTAPVARVDIVRQVDGARPAYVHAFEPGSREVNLTWIDSAAHPGATNMYYVRVMQADGKLAWASPFWIRYER